MKFVFDLLENIVEKETAGYNNFFPFHTSFSE